MSISLDNLPDIDFVIKDSEKIKAELIRDFEKASGRTLYPGDPLRLLILTFAKYFALLQNNIDLSAKQNLLKYADNGFIENIGALVGVERLEANAAAVSVKFTLSEIQESAVIVPKGTRVTCDNKVYFQTTEDCEINAGETEIVVLTECTEAGTAGNDYYTGQINKIVDPFGYLASVENVTVSSGGADRESVENFRERILMAPESFSTAGAGGAYEYLAKTANQDIDDVSVVSPNAGEVEIIPLMRNGILPAEEILRSVRDVCNADDKRPLTDKVLVSAPEPVGYDIDIKYYVAKSDTASGRTIQKNVSDAADKFILWQRSKLGRDINPSRLIQNIMTAGVKRVEVFSPIYKRIEYNQIAAAESVNIVYGGAEDD